jgi:tetratricopeptide (TPR) repeat protein
MGRPADALAVFEKSRRIFEQVYGETHMTVGMTMANMSIVLDDLGRYEEGIERASDCVRILTAAAGENHLMVAKCLSLRGNARAGQEDYEAGISDLHRALAMETEILGPDHPSLGLSLSNLSIAYDNMGKLEEAVQMQQQALDLLVAAHGETHNQVAGARMNLGFLERKRGNLERSLALYEAAAEHIAEFSKGLALSGVSEGLLLVGRADEAVHRLEETLAFLEGKPSALGSRGDAQFLMAQAQWELGEREAARAYAAQAVASLIAEGDEPLVEDVKRWLKAPRPYPR